MEVCLDGLWGTVCDDGWDSNDATTVCKQLGYNHSMHNQNYTVRAIPTRGAYFGEGSGPIHLSRADCNSCSKGLLNCNINKTGINGCNHGEDAGVICMGKIAIQTQSIYSAYKQNSPYQVLITALMVL